MKRLLRAAAILLSVAAGGVSYAQQAPSAPNTQPQAQTQAPPLPLPRPCPLRPRFPPKRRRPVPSSTGTRSISTRRKRRSRDAPCPDADLQNIRLQIEPILTEIRTVIDEQAPKLEASRQRLSQLGPKPEKGQPEESADVAKDRAEREAAVAELDETQRLGRALLVQAEQLSTQIGDLRRAGFTRALFEQSDGILSPSLWMNVVSGRSAGVAGAGDRRWAMPWSSFDAALRSASCFFLVSPSAWRSPFMSGGARSRRASSGAIPPSPIPSRRSRLLAALGVLAPRRGPGHRRQLDRLDRLRFRRYRSAAAGTGRPCPSERPRLHRLRARPDRRDPGAGPHLLAADPGQGCLRHADHELLRHPRDDHGRRQGDRGVQHGHRRRPARSR